MSVLDLDAEEERAKKELSRNNELVSARRCLLLIEYARELEEAHKQERQSKRDWVNRYIDLVGVGRVLALQQPAAHAKDQKEADLWARFYRLLDNAPVTFGDNLSPLPSELL